MNRGRELLARAGLVIAQYRWSHPEDQALHQLSQTINEYLEENPQDDPIAYWDTQEGKLIPAVPLSSERTCFKVPPVPLYLHPPRTEPARKPMTKEEIDSKFELDGSMFSSYTAFKQGVRFAEKHHGIGGNDE